MEHYTINHSAHLKDRFIDQRSIEKVEDCSKEGKRPACLH